jgi:hypothetical protein
MHSRWCIGELVSRYLLLTGGFGGGWFLRRGSGWASPCFCFHRFRETPALPPRHRVSPFGAFNLLLQVQVQVQQKIARPGTTPTVHRRGGQPTPPFSNCVRLTLMDLSSPSAAKLAEPRSLRERPRIIASHPPSPRLPGSEGADKSAHSKEPSDRALPDDRQPEHLPQPLTQPRDHQRMNPECNPRSLHFPAGW